MSNRELASKFQDLADMEEIEGNRWESLAYRKVAMSISTLSEDITEIEKKGALRQIEGVGAATEKKIVQYLVTGQIEKHEKLKEKYPVDFESLRNIQGLGPKRIALLFKELDVRNLVDLEAAVKEGRVSSVPGMGKKSEEALKKSIEVYKKTGSSRLFLALVQENLENLVARMKESGHFSKVEVAGSTRRKRETIGDLDILVVCEDYKKCTDFFTSMEEVEDILVKGETKISVRLRFGINCDLRIMQNESYGAAMQYFTGSKEHNIKMRDLAIEKGLKLNEYGLYRDHDRIAGVREEEIYSSLGMRWIPPELRENLGEISAAKESKLPNLVDYSMLKGDLHAHTNASDGTSTLTEMVERAKSMGHQYIALTDHSQSLKVANGLNEGRFVQRNNEIDRINERENSIKILKSAELEIKKDGTLDLPSNLLKEMDFVLVALHQWVGDNIKENTHRVVKALESGFASALAHPTGRLIGSRDAYKIDYERVFQACEDNKVALEINGFPERSDLPYDMVKKAKEYKIKFTIGSDAHNVSHLRFLRYASYIARRGWLEDSKIINCLPANRLFK